jgi:hypothetical protein
MMEELAARRFHPGGKLKSESSKQKWGRGIFFEHRQLHRQEHFCFLPSDL